MHNHRWLTPIGLMAAFLLGTAYGAYSGGPPPDAWDWFDTLVLLALVGFVVATLIVGAVKVAMPRQNNPFPLGYACGKCGERHLRNGQCAP